MSILEALAVARRSGEDAAIIVGGYVQTGPQMAQDHTAALSAPAPAAPAAGPGGPAARGGGGTTPGHIVQQEGGTTATVADSVTPRVDAYEIFKNHQGAIAFFFNHHIVQDSCTEEGPFWFAIQENNRLIAGTEEAYAVFENVKEDILELARSRGVIMLVEFEDQQPFRCTPCYLSDQF